MVVVDLKTGKYPPTGPRSSGTPSSASTSSPSTTARPTSWSATRSRSGGAELVQLRIGDDPAQGVQARLRCPGASALVEEQLDAGRAAVRATRSSWPGPAAHCDRCAFQALCPTKAAGVGALVTRRDHDPEQLARPARRATSPSATQQFAAITAPLEPAVVIAGAGRARPR